MSNARRRVVGLTNERLSHGPEAVFVRLRRDDPGTLQHLVRTGRRSAWTIQRARILLACDTSAEGPVLTDAQVAAPARVSAGTAPERP